MTRASNHRKDQHSTNPALLLLHKDFNIAPGLLNITPLFVVLDMHAPECKLTIMSVHLTRHQRHVSWLMWDTESAWTGILRCEQDDTTVLTVQNFKAGKQCEVIPLRRGVRCSMSP